MLDVEVKIKAYKPFQINVLNASQMILPPVASSLQSQDIEPWVTGIAYAYGDIVRNDGHYYWCIVAGTAGATAPVHTDGDASDGVATWRYVRWQRRLVTLANVSGTTSQIALARGYPAEANKGIVLYGNGVHNEGFDAVWAYQGAWYAISDSGTGRLLAISEG